MVHTTQARDVNAMQWWDRLNMILIIFAENCPMFEFSGRHCIGDAVRDQQHL